MWAVVLIGFPLAGLALALWAQRRDRGETARGDRVAELLRDDEET